MRPEDEGVGIFMAERVPRKRGLLVGDKKCQGGAFAFASASLHDREHRLTGVRQAAEERLAHEQRGAEAWRPEFAVDEPGFGHGGLDSDGLGGKKDNPAENGAQMGDFRRQDGAKCFAEGG